jgi:hypothetical protein
MTLENIYLVTQIVAVIALVPSLIYLALQVKQNTSQLRASARYQFVEATGMMNAAVVSGLQPASTFRRGLAGEALDADESMQFLIMTGQYFQIYSVMFELWTDKLLPDSQWHAVRKDLVTLMASPGGRRIWDDVMSTALETKFVNLVESLASSGEQSYSITPSASEDATP